MKSSQDESSQSEKSEKEDNGKEAAKPDNGSLVVMMKVLSVDEEPLLYFGRVQVSD